MHKQHKKKFFETDELDYRVAFRNDIMARQDFQKVCRSLCVFQTYSQQESFCGKKSFFLFHLCVDFRCEFEFNSTSQKHSTILYLCTESFQAENKVPLSNDLNFVSICGKNEISCQRTSLPRWNSTLS